MVAGASENSTRRPLRCTAVCHFAEVLPRKFGELDLVLKDPTSFGKWVYYGQLAEQYLKLARGACTRLIIYNKLFKPKIPWWAWVQEQFDPWSPQQTRLPELRQLRELQNFGLVPRFEGILTAGFGVALVLAASAQREQGLGSFTEKTIQVLEQQLSGALRELSNDFHVRLAAGLRLGEDFLRAFCREPNGSNPAHLTSNESGGTPGCAR